MGKSLEAFALKGLLSWTSYARARRNW